MHLIEIRDGIYAYLGDYDPHNGSNFGVVTSSEGVVVIDCKVTKEEEFLQEMGPFFAPRHAPPGPAEFLGDGGDDQLLGAQLGNQFLPVRGGTDAFDLVAF